MNIHFICHLYPSNPCTRIARYFSLSSLYWTPLKTQRYQVVKDGLNIETPLMDSHNSMLCLKESNWFMITSNLLCPQLSTAHSTLLIYFTVPLMYNSFHYRPRGTETCMDQVSTAAFSHRKGREGE